MGPFDVNVLNSIKFHPLPYTHITPSDVDAESYKRGWNDVIDSIIESAPTIEPERKKGAWINEGRIIRCNKCKTGYAAVKGMKSALTYKFCPNCGADMRGDQNG